VKCCYWLMYRRGLPPPPADDAEAERGTNGIGHNVMAAVADVSLDGRCLSLPDRLNRPSFPGLVNMSGVMFIKANPYASHRIGRYYVISFINFYYIKRENIVIPA